MAYYLATKKENPAIYNNMDGPPWGRYAKWNKLGRLR